MFKKDNDQNWLDRNLKYFFGLSVIPAFGFVSDFVLRILMSS